jgi:hypothetical protein
MTWTREAIEGLGPTVDVPTAASILGIGEWTGYDLIRRGEWDVTRVLRLGRKIKIPTHDLLVALYGAETADTGPPGNESGPGVTTPEGRHQHQRPPVPTDKTFSAPKIPHGAADRAGRDTKPSGGAAWRP